MTNPLCLMRARRIGLRARFIFLGFLSVILSVLQFAAVAASPGNAEHVIIMVWDGLRPDCITPKLTPELFALSQKGVFFKNHHPVYISSTEVNGTALITGAYPEHSGIGANREYRPSISWQEPVGTESLEVIRRADWLANGHYIAVPTLTETIQDAGFRTVVAGTKSVALLLDRSCERVSPGAKQSVDLYKGHTVPPSALAEVIKDCDNTSFPGGIRHPNSRQDAWTTKALTQSLWKTGVPKLSVLWMSDPDYSQHSSGPGSRTACRALKSADENLAAVLKALDEKKVRDKTDIFIVSDHGFSTIKSGVDVEELLKKAKFKAVRKFEDPEPGQILVVGLGGSVELYVFGHDEFIIRNLVSFLQNQDFTGVIFTRSPMAGTFSLEQVKLNSTYAPDIVVSMRWTGESNMSCMPGMLITDGGTRGKGSHGSLSPFDMRNSLVAAGPDFKSGWIDKIPSGNIDLAPTILAILGIQPIHPMDGRVLREAFADFGGPLPEAETKTIEVSNDYPLTRWSQRLKYSTVDNAMYFHEGTGESVRR